MGESSTWVSYYYLSFYVLLIGTPTTTVRGILVHDSRGGGRRWTLAVVVKKIKIYVVMTCAHDEKTKYVYVYTLRTSGAPVLRRRCSLIWRYIDVRTDIIVYIRTIFSDPLLNAFDDSLRPPNGNNNMHKLSCICEVCIINTFANEMVLLLDARDGPLLFFA